MPTFYTLPRELRQQILLLTLDSLIADNIKLQNKNHTPMCTWYFDKQQQCLDLQNAFPELAEDVEFVMFKATKAVHDAFVPAVWSRAQSNLNHRRRVYA